MDILERANMLMGLIASSMDHSTTVANIRAAAVKELKAIEEELTPKPEAPAEALAPEPKAESETDASPSAERPDGMPSPTTLNRRF